MSWKKTYFGEYGKVVVVTEKFNFIFLKGFKCFIILSLSIKNLTGYVHTFDLSWCIRSTWLSTDCVSVLYHVHSLSLCKFVYKVFTCSILLQIQMQTVHTHLWRFTTSQLKINGFDTKTFLIHPYWMEINVICNWPVL